MMLKSLYKVIIAIIMPLNLLANNGEPTPNLEQYVCIVVDVATASGFRAINRNIALTESGESDYFELKNRKQYIYFKLEDIFGTEYLLQKDLNSNKIILQTYLFSFNNKSEETYSYIMLNDNTSYILSTSDHFHNISIKALESLTSSKKANTVNMKCNRLTSKSTRLIEKLSIRSKITPAFQVILNHK